MSINHDQNRRLASADVCSAGNMVKYEVTTLFGAGRSTPSPDDWYYIDTPETCRVYYVHSGSAIFMKGEEKKPLTAGKLYFLPPRLPFRAVQNRESPMNHTHFDFIMHPQVVSEEIVEIDCGEYPELAALIQAADLMLKRGVSFVRDAENPSAGTRRYLPITGCLETIMNIIAEIHALKTVDDPDILTALDIMESGYSSGLSIGEIAERLGYNTDYFIRKFKKAMGTTPHAYIKALRLHEAELLRRSGKTLAETAVRIGYADPASLAHAMKRSVSDNK